MPEMNDILKNNPEAIVPDYVKKAMMEDASSDKKYGTTVFDYVPPKDEEVKMNDFFSDKEYSDEDTEKERKELQDIIDSQERKIKEITSTDALSGITSSVPDSSYVEAYNEINKTIDASNIKGKTITKYGRQLLSSLIGDDPTEDELSLIASKFEEHHDLINNSELDESGSVTQKTGFYMMETALLRSFLSERILNAFDALCSPESDNYSAILARLLEQIYIAYDNVIGYRDDIKELNELAMQIDSSGMLDAGSYDMSDPKSLDHMSEKIEKYMDLMKNLDSRNQKMKQDYRIDDIEIYLFADVKECLDSALNFTKVIQKTDTASSKFIKDLKNRNDTNRSIDNWIHDIKHDSKTLYTFPCNDFLSDSESREELVKFFFNAYLVHIVYKNKLDVPAEAEIVDYLIDNGYLNSDNISNLKDMAYCMLYVLSRAFKYNKVKEDTREIRILSYTLDIISKLGVVSHRRRFIETSEYVFSKLYPHDFTTIL